MTIASLARIPVVDVRHGGPVRHAAEGRARARALRDECIDWLPRPCRGAAAGDGWDDAPLAQAIPFAICRGDSCHRGRAGFSGIWFLNGCYQWGCTALAREQGDMPWLARTLDWPFPGLGRHVEVARMRGNAGEFDSVTWPGYAGVLTASAPGASPPASIRHRCGDAHDSHGCGRLI